LVISKLALPILPKCVEVDLAGGARYAAAEWRFISAKL
jgi:hypothetical protein